ncbi:MAG TPA: type I-U CRISPR-associated protein Csx17 [Solirubrobacterales bacterium]|nr:type I-U CRISPR-associated protein Csx17 [Solirubrobacterales bacterium]
MPEVRLTGCAARPLTGYLKALGLLRVVSSQADANARGRWQNGVFELSSTLDRDALTLFLLGAYSPAPVVSPWNGGSGFYPKDRREPIDAIEGSTDHRLAAYRAAIASARAAIEGEGLAEKPSRDAKLALVRRLRRTVPDEALAWVDAAIVIRGGGLAYPPLLGSGGNDGRFDFSNNYARCIVECLLEPDGKRSGTGLSAALWTHPAELDPKLSLAHLSRDSSPNNSPHGEADSLGNPWDLILAVEGMLVLVSGAVRRHGSGLAGSLSAPFTVHLTSAGFGSAAEGESGRAELWLPLWGGWATLAELTVLAREARAQVGGTSRRQATTGLDLARAAGELGVVRGIDAFERYAILERAGQSNLAVPVGRVAVEERPSARALRGIDAWLSRVLRFARRDECPQGPGVAIRRLEKAAFEFAAKGDEASGCVALEAIGAVEAALARSSASAKNVRPLVGGPAKPWVDAADDGTPEFALAVAIASLRDRSRRKKGGGARGAPPTMRDYVHGTITNPHGQVRFDPRRSRAISAQGPYPLLATLHARRHLDAVQANEGDGVSFPLATPVPLEAARLLAAGLDERQARRIVALLRGLVLFDYNRERVTLARPALSHTGPAPQPTYELLALAWQPLLAGKLVDPRRRRADENAGEPARETLDIGARPGWAPRLAAGAVRPAIDDAFLRLRMAGLPPSLHPEDLNRPRGTDRDLGHRLAAALLLQIEARGLQRLLDTYIPARRTKTKGTPHDRRPAR